MAATKRTTQNLNDATSSKSPNQQKTTFDLLHRRK